MSTVSQPQTQPSINDAVFRGCIPALMTPIGTDGKPDLDALVRHATNLVEAGMSGVVYCGSMGDWPLLSDQQRRDGVSRLVDAGIKVVVGTGSQSPKVAVEHAAHAAQVGAAGLMIIPRLLSRGISEAAQATHFAEVLSAARELPAVIYNSPYYGYQTKADLYFRLRRANPNLVGFKEFGGAESLRYAAEHITSGADGGMLLVGVDTQVYFGFLQCGAEGAITGIGNCLPAEVLQLVSLCRRAAAGDSTARRYARELDEALAVLSRFDEGPDLTLYYRLIASETIDPAYRRTALPTDQLSPSQERYAIAQLRLFQSWWNDWSGKDY
ncbi:dihydrodipicolinate synthase family protein [Roseiconus nitratireducens]|uniref:Dihydrodipicolinate synthase family protein n=1 Tax=Roseiconus nitratireducens TaxID=2605748 RepID=A0A5M6DLN4_9BACT|nr:dihydrodipicolinate synthase family protein [Roseiconus nitratireducens]KAA5547040.1 dihydrodipicolinate synthase family protein [Roseiconus nitratireducens]